MLSPPGYVCDGEDVTDDGVESLDVMDHQEPLQGLVTDPPLRPESPDIPHWHPGLSIGRGVRGSWHDVNT